MNDTIQRLAQWAKAKSLAEQEVAVAKSATQLAAQATSQMQQVTNLILETVPQGAYVLPSGMVAVVGSLGITLHPLQDASAFSPLPMFKDSENTGSANVSAPFTNLIRKEEGAWAAQGAALANQTTEPTKAPDKLGFRSLDALAGQNPAVFMGRDRK